MSKGRNVATPNVKVPENPVYIEFERSDGDARTWPRNTVQQQVGEINWMEHIPIDNPTALKWRLQVGHHIAVDKGIDAPERAILRDWPPNYRMYDHNKGQANGTVRHDIYLYGPAGKRFRSINEFIPHAIWLLRDESLKPENCACKYCSKRQQREISSTLDKLVQSPTPTPSAGPSGTPLKHDLYSRLQKEAHKAHSQNHKQGRREPQPRQPKSAPPKVYATVQKVLKPIPKASEHILRQAVLSERHDDLRAVYSSSANKKEGLGPIGLEDAEPKPDSGLRRWYRTAEVVWCKLPGIGIIVPKELASSAEEDAKIEFWPGVVESWNLKNTPVPRPSSSPIAPPTTLSTPPSDTDLPNKQPGIEDNPEVVSAPPPWTVKQLYAYRIRLLAVDVLLDIEDNQILPYLAYNPPKSSMKTIGELPIHLLDFDRDNVARFDPLKMATHDAKGKGKARMSDGELDQINGMYEAGSAFALAVQIAETISSYWSVTDKYDFRYISTKAKPPPVSSDPQPATAAASSNPIPSISSAPKPVLKPPQGMSLDSAIASAGIANASYGKSVDYYTHHDISRPTRVTTAEAEQAAKAALGEYRGASAPTGGSSMADAITEAYNNLSASTYIPRPIASKPPTITTAGHTDPGRSPAGALQMRFQGLWWGPERIWGGDFVRLKISRGALAPYGGQNVLKPSGPGKGARALWYKAKKAYATSEELKRKARLMGKGWDPEPGGIIEEMERMSNEFPERVEQFGAMSRGTFMKIDSLFSVDVNKDGKVKKEMRAAGMLYELADDDYEEGDDRDEDEMRFEATVNEAMLPPSTPKTDGNEASTVDPSPSPTRKVIPSSPPNLYYIPQPPHGFKFRPILAEGYEAIISLSLIAGRYYPRICCHPLIRPSLQELLKIGHDREQFINLWSLEGLWSGHHNSINPEEYKKNRTAMIEDADRVATTTLEEFKLQALPRTFSSASSLFGDGDDDIMMEDSPGVSAMRLGYPMEEELRNGMDVDQN